MADLVDLTQRLRVVPRSEAQEGFPVVAGVVTVLERLLEQAKAGKVRGVAYAAVRYLEQDDTGPAMWTWAGSSAVDGRAETTNILLAGITMMSHDVIQQEVVSRMTWVEVEGKPDDPA